MLKRLALAVGLVSSLLAWQTAMAAEALPPATEWVPQDAVLALELSRPRALLDPLLDEKVAAAVTSLPIYEQLAAKTEFKQFLAVVDFLEATLATDWKTGLGKLTGGGVTLAVCPKDTVLLFVDAEDERLLKRLHEIFVNFARSEAEKQGQPDRVASNEYLGITAWTFNGDEAHAIVGKRLILASNPGGLKTVLEMRAESATKSLASLPSYQAAKRAVGADAAAMAFANLEVLKALPNVAEMLKLERQNPLAALLFAGITEAIRTSNWLAWALNVEGDTLSLQALLDGKTVDPSGPAAFALPSKVGEGALPNLSVPRRIAALSFHRDLHGFYAAKDDLFPERTSGLIFFENMMGIFFSGLDLTEEVLGETEPEVRLVVAQQAYDPAAGTPQMQMPAFAAVFRLRNPEEFGEVVEEAWQKAVGLINFTRGQQAQPGLIIDRPTHADVKYTMASFRAPPEGDRQGVDSRFNFRPALARLGDYLIISSTDGLAADLIDALKKEIAEQVKPLAETHSVVEFSSMQLASILGTNRESLVRQNMVKEGNTQQEAETQTDLIVTVLKYLGTANLDIGSRDGRPRAELEWKLNLP